MVKGLLVGFLWGGIVAGVLVLVFSLATMTPPGQLADDAVMPALVGTAPDGPAENAPTPEPGADLAGLPRDPAPDEPGLPEIAAQPDAPITATPPESADSPSLAGLDAPVRGDEPGMPPSGALSLSAMAAPEPVSAFAAEVPTDEDAPLASLARARIAAPSVDAEPGIELAPPLGPNAATPIAAIAPPPASSGVAAISSQEADATVERGGVTASRAPLIESAPRISSASADRPLRAPQDPMVETVSLEPPSNFVAAPEMLGTQSAPQVRPAAILLPQVAISPPPDPNDATAIPETYVRLGAPETEASVVQSQPVAQATSRPVERPALPTATPQSDAPPQVQTEVAIAAGEAQTSPAPARPTVLATTSGLGLPQVGRLGVSSEPAPAAVPDAMPDTAGEIGENLPALVRFAAPFDATETRPLLAIILVRDPDTPIDLDALEALPAPASIALHPRGDALALADALRAAGREVVMQIEATHGTEISTYLSQSLEELPQVVAFLDDADGGLQSERAALDAVFAQMQSTGQGLVTYPRGFNPAERRARQEGLSAVTVFRALSDAGPDMDRVLDRAAFNAGLEGRAVVVAPLRPEVIAQLVSWSLGDRSESVAMAPVSAVLQAQ